MSDTEQTVEPTREDLIAAAEEATGGEVGAVAPTTPAAEPAAVPTEEEPRWQRIVREREKGHAERQEAQSYAQQQRAEADAERAKILAEAREQAKAEAARELAEQRKKFSADPIAHLRSLGTPEEIQDAVLREGSPEARAMRKLQDELAETKQKAASVDDVRKQFDEYKAAQTKAEVDRQNAYVRNKFMTEFASAEKSPYMNARYEPDELFAKADSIARSWVNAGQSFDMNDVAQYMEYEAKKRYDALSASPQPQVNGAASVSGSAPKVPANGPRTISPTATSSRQAAPKPLAEMTPQQQRQALVEEAEEAMKAFDARK